MYLKVFVTNTIIFVDNFNSLCKQRGSNSLFILTYIDLFYFSSFIFHWCTESDTLGGVHVNVDDIWPDFYFSDTWPNEWKIITDLIFYVVGLKKENKCYYWLKKFTYSILLFIQKINTKEFFSFIFWIPKN